MIELIGKPGRWLHRRVTPRSSNSRIEVAHVIGAFILHDLINNPRPFLLKNILNFLYREGCNARFEGKENWPMWLTDKRRLDPTIFDAQIGVMTMKNYGH